MCRRSNPHLETVVSAACREILICPEIGKRAPLFNLFVEVFFIAENPKVTSAGAGSHVKEKT
jgi:hypothetical protein